MEVALLAIAVLCMAIGSIVNTLTVNRLKKQADLTAKVLIDHVEQHRHARR